MSAQILNGKEFANHVLESVASGIEDGGLKPTLVIYRIGNDPASKVYVNNKVAAAAKININTIVRSYEETDDYGMVQNQLYRDVRDNNIDGIMIQLPLPKGWDEIALMELIPAEKDVDGLTYENRGMLSDCSAFHIPCTALGIIQMLDYYGIDLEGKHCVVVGRSDIVGKPVAQLALMKNATVTICHSHTKNLAEITKQADVLIAAVGKEKLITADMVKPGAVVVDVGINRNAEGKLCGDVDFENVKEIASWITPVPGGVGPVTVAMLMYNTYNALYLR